MMFESRLLTKRKVDFGALARLLGSNAAHGVRRDEGFYPLGVEPLFELYRWVMTSVTGKNWDRWTIPGRWGRYTLCDTFSGRSSVNGTAAEPFRGSYDRNVNSLPPWGWRQEMARRFGAILFSEHGLAVDWRKAMGIDLAKPKTIAMSVYDNVPPPPRATLYGFHGEPLGWSMSYGRHDGNRRGFGGEIDRLFALATPARRLIPQLNSFHADARYLLAVKLAPTATGWVVSTEYGVDGSSWGGPGVIQRAGEPFANFIYRAHDKIDAMLTPGCGTGKTPRCIDAALPIPPKARWAVDMRYDGAQCEASPNC